MLQIFPLLPRCGPRSQKTKISTQIAAATAITPVTDSGMINSSDGAVIRIYVPDEGESAWDVEKKFRLPGEARQEGKLYVV